jgi:GT2 family glycosyltransferase
MAGKLAPVASVVVMTFNRPDSLRRCLNSLAAQCLDPLSFEVVVVDVSSPPVDEVLAPFQQRLQISHQLGPNRGVAANRNLGAEWARGEVLAFLDDDCIASTTWLADLVTAVERDTNDLVGAPTVHPSPETATAAAGQVINDLVDGFFNPPGREPGFLPGLNFAVDRRRFLYLGGCDIRFGFLAAEDRDFIDRWQRAGGRLALCEGSWVRHEHRSSLRGFVRQYFNYGRGAWLFHRLRQRSKQGRLWSDARLHMALPLRLADPMRRVPPRMRVQVLLLIAVWQLANLAGFLWQAMQTSQLLRPQEQS